MQTPEGKAGISGTFVDSEASGLKHAKSWNFAVDGGDDHEDVDDAHAKIKTTEPSSADQRSLMLPSCSLCKKRNVLHNPFQPARPNDKLRVSL